VTTGLCVLALSTTLASAASSRAPAMGDHGQTARVSHGNPMDANARMSKKKRMKKGSMNNGMSGDGMSNGAKSNDMSGGGMSGGNTGGGMSKSSGGGMSK
jgi:hypothetical protein